MSESTTPPSEPTTAPVATETHTAPATVREEPRRSRVTAAAAWVGLVAGVVFVVAVVFFSGFILGAHSGGHGGGQHRGGPGGPGAAAIHRGPPPMFPMGPRGDFERSGPGFAPERPGGPTQSPSSPTTTTPARP